MNKKKNQKKVSVEGELACKVIETKTKLMKEPPKIKRKPAIKWLKMIGYELKEFEHEEVKMKLIIPKNKKNNCIILQLHGGAYLYSLNEDILQKYRIMAKMYSKAAQDCQVLTVDYRVAPEDPYPAALEDAIKAYLWLLSNNYEAKNIIIVGDSAGGGLCLATVLYLRDHQMPLPKGIITMSAWTNLTATGASVKENFDIDPVFGINENASEFMYHPAYAKGSQPENPYISPLFGDYTGFPPMLMQVGEREMLLSDTVEVAKKARQQQVKVTESTYKGMMHDFQMAGSILPEADKAWKEISDFIIKL